MKTALIALLALCLPVAVAVFSSGCLNMPTQESQITGFYVSPQKYKKYSDDDLTAELNSLSRREAQLKIAQNQRVKTSTTKAFLWGFGDGDGIEASELANVRGSLEAARREMESRKNTPKPSDLPSGRPLVDPDTGLPVLKHR